MLYTIVRRSSADGAFMNSSCRLGRGRGRVRKENIFNVRRHIYISRHVTRHVINLNQQFDRNTVHVFYFLGNTTAQCWCPLVSSGVLLNPKILHTHFHLQWDLYIMATLWT